MEFEDKMLGCRVGFEFCGSFVFFMISLGLIIVMVFEVFIILFFMFKIVINEGIWFLYSL